MDPERLRLLLEQVQAGETSVDDALNSLRSLPFEDLGFAKLDHHRALRNGFPEVIYCPGKTTEHILAIIDRMIPNSRKILASRAAPEVAEAVRQAFPQAVYHALPRMLVIPGEQNEPPASLGATMTFLRREKTEETQGEPVTLEPEEVRAGGRFAAERGFSPAANRAGGLGKGTVLIVSAGTADLPIAEEAAITASEMGSPVERLYDVGVAGIHRLLGHSEELFAANVLVVVAGMEGALASVVGGLVARPVIAVPTSVGYGASFGGLSALLTMLNSCASGVGVVNIDNGFGAGFLAHLINQ
jgi:NCAIR mutase (PurE)-related protein